MSLDTSIGERTWSEISRSNDFASLSVDALVARIATGFKSIKKQRTPDTDNKVLAEAYSNFASQVETYVTPRLDDLMQDPRLQDLVSEHGQYIFADGQGFHKSPHTHAFYGRVGLGVGLVAGIATAAISKNLIYGAIVGIVSTAAVGGGPSLLSKLVADSAKNKAPDVYVNKAPDVYVQAVDNFIGKYG